MRYGVPYQGSKNSIAREIVEFLPSADTLIDICAGGYAVTHAALELCEGFAPKWNRIISNDINPMPGKLFRDAIDGKYDDETRWISREDFHRLKASDPYVAYCWSFGNNTRNYLYAEEKEPWMRAVHYARVLVDLGPMREFGIDSDGREKDIREHEWEYREKYIKWWIEQQPYSPDDLDTIIKDTKKAQEEEEESLWKYLLDAQRKSGLKQNDVAKQLQQHSNHYFSKSSWRFPPREVYSKMQEIISLEKSYEDFSCRYVFIKKLHYLLHDFEGINSLQSLQRLQRLQSLQRLQRLKTLEQTALSYDQVEIPDHAVVYADIPYENTACDAYEGFDHKKFYEWAAQQRVPVFISSYEICDPRFVCVWEKDKRCLLQAGGGGSIRTERIYTQRKGA